MSQEAAEQVGSVAMLGVSLASTMILVESASSVMKGTQAKMKSLKRQAPKRRMKIPSIEDAIFGKKRRK